ncbi:hypothetical protein QBZ16_004281 [Prototheca wickerhamii]|uniref:1-phosphatidylinositol 4-kinase n=1 Tax=Prototheca wickerhamii TaxID=3111 RepID=A0AAD9IFG7_PROWI|nr:hypothetical protein QBZ16_004281 [Prototheca wickerhamii]
MIAVLSPGRDNIGPVTQRGFVVRKDAGVDALSSVRDAPEPGLLSALGSLPRRHPPTLAVATPPALLDAGVAEGSSAGELRLVQCATLTAGAKSLIRGVTRGLKAWQEPEAAAEGFGGTYFFKDERGECRAIMKPCDEEPLAPNNPKGFVGRRLGDPGLKPTVRVGEAAAREVAAYLLDRGHFSRVPHTVMVEMAHPIFHVAAGDEAGEGAGIAPPAAPAPRRKLGSLQEFVPHECDTSELGASRFSVADVHRIGILDVRLFNTDRHAGNILVRRREAAHEGAGNAPGATIGAPIPTMTTSTTVASATSSFLGRHENAYELIPIDHGFALPEELEPPYFEWQHWPQAMMPFSAEELEYIASLDARADAAMLRRELPCLREECLRLLEVSTLLLQRCAAAGMSLAEIAGVVTRPIIGIDEEASELEKICYAARREVEAALRGGRGDAARRRRVPVLEEEEEEEEDDDDEFVESDFLPYEDDISEEDEEDEDGDRLEAEKSAASGAAPVPDATTPSAPSAGIESMWMRGGASSLFALGLAESLTELSDGEDALLAERAPSTDRDARAPPRRAGRAGAGRPLPRLVARPHAAPAGRRGRARPSRAPFAANPAALRIAAPGARRREGRFASAGRLQLAGKALPGTPVAVVSQAASAAFASPATTSSAVSSLQTSVSSAGGAAAAVGRPASASLAPPRRPPPPARPRPSRRRWARRCRWAPPRARPWAPARASSAGTSPRPRRGQGARAPSRARALAPRARARRGRGGRRRRRALLRRLPRPDARRVGLFHALCAPAHQRGGARRRLAPGAQAGGQAPPGHLLPPVLSSRVRVRADAL